MFARCLQNVCEMFAKYLRDACKIFVRCLQNVCEIFAKYPRGIRLLLLYYSSIVLLYYGIIVSFYHCIVVLLYHYGRVCSVFCFLCLVQVCGYVGMCKAAAGLGLIFSGPVQV